MADIAYNITGTLESIFNKEELMFSRRRKWLTDGLLTAALAGFLLAMPAAGGQEKPDLEKIPKIVMDALKAKFPKAALKEIMAITAVTDGKEALEGYEILLKTAGKKEIEVSVAPDGKFLEDSGEKK